jgi:L-ribulose-5-phosphate 3-epimerase UlaE
MIVGASLGSFKGLGLEPAIELYLKLSREFNLGAVEIRLEKEKGRPSAWVWEVDDKITDFLANFEVAGAHLPFVCLNPISLNPEVKAESIKQLELAIDKAVQLKMNYVVMHTRGLAHGLSRDQQMSRWEQVIRQFTQHAEEHSILLTVENADFLSNLKELADMVRRINSPWLKITLDTGHAYVRRARQWSSYPLTALVLKAMDMTFVPLVSSKYMPYQDYGSIRNFVESEFDLIYNLHIHDHNGRRDHITLGSGKIDFSFIPGVKGLPLIIEAEFKEYYQDFKRNYERLVNLAEQG